MEILYEASPNLSSSSRFYRRSTSTSTQLVSFFSHFRLIRNCLMHVKYLNEVFQNTKV
jgi:hypothetical protein